MASGRTSLGMQLVGGCTSGCESSVLCKLHITSLMFYMKLYDDQNEHDRNPIRDAVFGTIPNSVGGS